MGRCSIWAGAVYGPVQYMGRCSIWADVVNGQLQCMGRSHYLFCPLCIVCPSISLPLLSSLYCLSFNPTAHILHRPIYCNGPYTTTAHILHRPIYCTGPYTAPAHILQRPIYYNGPYTALARYYLLLSISDTPGSAPCNCHLVGPF
jgi:hypothetical protein